MLLCTQRVARLMVEHQLGGSITTITSIEGTRAAPGYAAYAAAKAGVINYTKTAALELAPHGIRVNALAPHFTLTEGLELLAGAAGMLAAKDDMIPMGRAGHVDEMAASAVFGLGHGFVHHRPDHSRRRRHRGRWRVDHRPGTGEYVLGPP